MNNSNLNENVPQKENIILKILKMFGTYIKNLFYDFFTSFKYNNMKLAGFLVAVPGVFIGFFMGLHADIVNDITYTIYEVGDSGAYAANYMFDFDFSAVSLFVLMLFGILNIFTAATMMGKKNLGSVVVASLTSFCIIVAGILYCVAIFSFMEGVKIYNADGKPLYDAALVTFNAYNEETIFEGKKIADILAENAGPDGLTQFKSLENLINYAKQQYFLEHYYEIGIPIGDYSSTFMGQKNIINLYLSLGSIFISMLCPLIGCIIGYIKYDRNYEKVER